MSFMRICGLCFPKGKGCCALVVPQPRELSPRASFPLSSAFPTLRRGEISLPTGVNGGDINQERRASPLFTIKYIYHTPAPFIFLSPPPVLFTPPPPPFKRCRKPSLRGSGLRIGVAVPETRRCGASRGRCHIALSQNKTARIHFPVKWALNKPDVSKHGSADCKACTNTPG